MDGEGQGPTYLPLGTQQTETRKASTVPCYQKVRAISGVTLRLPGAGHLKLSLLRDQWMWQSRPREFRPWAQLQLPTLTFTSEASVAYVSFRQCQFCLPSVSATPGRLYAQCLAMSLSTVWARVGSVMDTYSSNRGWGIISWETGEKGNSMLVGKKEKTQKARSLELGGKNRKSKNARGLPEASSWRASCSSSLLLGLKLKQCPHSPFLNSSNVWCHKEQSRMLVCLVHTALENGNYLFL